MSSTAFWKQLPTTTWSFCEASRPALGGSAISVKRPRSLQSRHDRRSPTHSPPPSPPLCEVFLVPSIHACSREFTPPGPDVFAVAPQHRDRQQLYAAIAHDVHAHFCSQMLFSNIDDGYLEGLLRGLRSGILSSTDYANLCQCESIDGARARACSPAPR
jgi:hypothetical protein